MMTDIEALLSVDAGKTPPGVVAFFMGDANRGTRRALFVSAGVLFVGAIVCACTGMGRVPVSLLLLAAAVIAVSATPTVDPYGDRVIKRQVMVVTANGLIVRDAWGLKSWRLEDLVDVIPGVYDSRPYLEIIEQSGARHTIETVGFRRGDRVRQVINSRLRLRQVHPG